MSEPATRTWHDYDYAVVRVVPRVHLCTFLNIGVVIHARTAGYLASRFHLDLTRLTFLCRDVDVDLLQDYVAAYERVCSGGRDAGPIGVMPPSERFHWLTAPRSTVLQTSDLHAGRAHDLSTTLDRLLSEYVVHG
ncbi:MAG TPA: DUF3037 domain-containing protein [Rhodothermales bacterium]|nr:DUF3037 domain-containing protein [Rhodothermales bacterium]